MSRKIRLKRGALKDLPQLELGEPGVATDEGTMFIGTDRGNIRLANQEDFDGVSQQLADKAGRAELFDTKSEVSKKADKSFVDAAIANIGNASPKGVYPSIADLQATFPDGFDGIYLTEDDGHWYFWNGSEIVDGGVYQSAGVGTATVDFTALNPSLVNRLEGTNSMSDFLMESGVIGTSGSLNAANYGVRSSVFIRVSAGTRIRLADFATGKMFRVAEYEIADQSFIKNEVNLTAPYFVMEDRLIKLTVTNTDQTAISDMSAAGALLLIDHSFAKFNKSKLEYEGKTSTLTYDQNGKLLRIVENGESEIITTNLNYSGDQLTSVEKNNGKLKTTTSYVFADGQLQSLITNKEVIS